MNYMPNVSMLYKYVEEYIQENDLTRRPDIYKAFMNGVAELEGAILDGLESNDLQGFVDQIKLERKCIQANIQISELSNRLLTEL